MTKKNKNIIAIFVIVVLLICLGLTFHFAKNDRGGFKVDNKNTTFRDNLRKNENSIEDNNIKKDSEESEDAVTETSDKRTKRDSAKRRNLPSNFDKNGEFNPKTVMPNGFNQNRGMSTKYVILIAAECFLLGGAVVYLIMNNLEKETKVIETRIVEEKETKRKKES